VADVPAQRRNAWPLRNTASAPSEPPLGPCVFFHRRGVENGATRVRWLEPLLWTLLACHTAKLSVGSAPTISRHGCGHAIELALCVCVRVCVCCRDRLRAAGEQRGAAWKAQISCMTAPPTDLLARFQARISLPFVCGRWSAGVRVGPLIFQNRTLRRTHERGLWSGRA
jgi:hypothetical protein